MKQKYYLATLLLGTLVTGCKQTGETTTVEPVKVKVLTVEEHPINGTQGFSGTVEEMTGSTLSFPVGGTVGTIAVTVGQRVAKGTLIAAVDEVTLQNTYNASVALLTQAEDAWQRLKQLHDNGSLPEIQWVEAQSNLKQAAASEQIARKNLSDCRLTAPFSGIISEKNVETGQNVMPGMSVVKLVTIQQVKVKVAVPENEIAQIKIGQTARITVAALENRMFEGKIIEKGVAANALSRSYEVKVLIDNPEQILMPGMICQMHIDKSESEATAFILPVQVVQLDESNRSFVWVNTQGRAEKRMIQTGELTNRGVVVKNGLASGEEVIIEGQQKVSVQTPITTER